MIYRKLNPNMHFIFFFFIIFFSFIASFKELDRGFSINKFTPNLAKIIAYLICNEDGLHINPKSKFIELNLDRLDIFFILYFLKISTLIFFLPS